MSSENVSGADNQQGRPQGLLTPDYLAGFVDGEGCFSVSIRPHPTVRYGNRWHVAPCFQVYQHRSNIEVLEMVREHFGCGRITSKSGSVNVMTFAVYSRKDLVAVVIPFFERHPLLSGKQRDFEKFREIVFAMQREEHRTKEGFRRIVELAFSMNQRGKGRRYSMDEVLAEPSETVRRASAECR